MGSICNNWKALIIPSEYTEYKFTEALNFSCTKKSGDEMTREIELFKDVIEVSKMQIEV